MTLDNPGSFNQFEAENTEIPTQQLVSEYSGKLAAHRTAILLEVADAEKIWGKGSNK